MSFGTVSGNQSYGAYNGAAGPNGGYAGGMMRRGMMGGYGSFCGGYAFGTGVTERV